jgi:Putative addiction module component
MRISEFGLGGWQFSKIDVCRQILSIGTGPAMVGGVSVLELKEEVSRLSKAEQLQAMEWLWASLSEESQGIESPEWHGDVLAARKAKLEAGEAKFLSFAELKERLRR